MDSRKDIVQSQMRQWADTLPGAPVGAAVEEAKTRLIGAKAAADREHTRQLFVNCPASTTRVAGATRVISTHFGLHRPRWKRGEHNV
jgi:hypothetical protein